ncbi:UvrB/UvrC motif-containing protein [Yinghuangia soli]|uniref:UvrB/UvrC motif-containing protein n=1 Tax=Yinghuangia soli TaxID=2908204 RepID=A0AA41PU42_9ACTN|nr:UvrB/UvrC motif-containing protein [Yinghuangia soli]MCF2525768.1 UvrB/UvrC motif-containing protein [Yinghuangia soli]
MTDQPPGGSRDVDEWVAAFLAKMGEPVPGKWGEVRDPVAKTIVELLAPLPAAVAGPTQVMREARAAKEQAIDAEDYDAAAAFRDGEKAATMERRAAVAAWADEAGARVLAEQLLAVHAVADELASLLSEHGIPLPVRLVEE